MSEAPSPSSPEAPPTGHGEQYTVIARRYRPQTFDELIGQEHVARALAGAIRTQRVGHAYLFTGARGVGKTSTARLLAKALNCQRGPTSEPCNQCDSCQGIAAGDDVDVLEIDGASNRGIDEIRELRQNVGIRPSRSRYKIYIIDEVHMLTREAFNALLKTLEEPPEHVKFIFCTTEAEKIPVTILSRCQRFDFAGLQSESIVSRLAQIVANEGARAEPEALAALARRAAGSMRDSQSLLEQLLSIGGPNITAADVHRLLGTADDRRIGAVVAKLAAADAGGALAELDAALAEGVDVGQLLEQLLGALRDLMVVAAGGPPDLLAATDAGQREATAALATTWGLDGVLAAMQIVDQTLARLRYSAHGRVLAELALVRISRVADLDDLTQLAADLRDAPAAELAAARPAARPANAPPARTTGDLEAGLKKNVESLADSLRVARENASSPPAGSAQLSSDSIERIWKQILETSSDMIADHASFYDRVAISAPNDLVVTFREKYTSCKSFCERPEQRAKLELALAEAAGAPIRLRFEIVADPPEAAPAIAPRQPVRSRQEELKEASETPLVARAIELFDARPVRVDGPDD